MSSKEFVEWCAYDRTSPGYPERGDIQVALLAATLVNCHRSKKSKPAKIKDFLLTFKKRITEAAPQDVIRMKLESWMTGHNKVMKDGQEFLGQRARRRAERKEKRAKFFENKKKKLKG